MGLRRQRRLRLQLRQRQRQRQPRNSNSNNNNSSSSSSSGRMRRLAPSVYRVEERMLLWVPREEEQDSRVCPTLWGCLAWAL